jgi:proteic killer suppression protein
VYIRGFRHKGLRRLYDTGDGRGIRADLVPKVKLIIHAIEQARRVEQVGRFPGWKLQWSVWVTGNFRLTFHVKEDDVLDLDLEDYHGK